MEEEKICIQTLNKRTLKCGSEIEKKRKKNAAFIRNEMERKCKFILKIFFSFLKFFADFMHKELKSFLVYLIVPKCLKQTCRSHWISYFISYLSYVCMQIVGISDRFTSDSLFAAHAHTNS